MAFTNKERREAAKKLPESITSFALSNKTTGTIGELIKRSEISEPNQDYADSEILDALLGLKSLSEAIENIAKLENKQVAQFSKLKADLQVGIFNEIDKIRLENLKGGGKVIISNEQKVSEEKNLPDASAGLISDHEEIQKNPIKVNESKPPQPSQTPISKTLPVQINSQPKPTTIQAPQQIPTPPKITSVPSTQMSWEGRKKKAEEALKNIAPVETKKYPGGADPYREPV